MPNEPGFVDPLAPKRPARADALDADQTAAFQALLRSNNLLHD
jgi:hypothetical protein